MRYTIVVLGRYPGSQPVQFAHHKANLERTRRMLTVSAAEDAEGGARCALAAPLENTRHHSALILAAL